MKRREVAWLLVAAGAAALAGVAARQALEAGWRMTRHKAPPVNPASPHVTWAEALTWTLATSVVVGFFRLFAQRGAAAGWRRLTGGLPPGL